MNLTIFIIILLASSNESNWISDITRSTEAEYVVINGKNEVEGNQKAPIFTTVRVFYLIKKREFFF